MIRCVPYYRVSTNSKDQENSYENQALFFKREIPKLGYVMVDTYADKGISGTKLNRPEFDRMLYDAGLDIIEVINNDGDDRKMAKKYVTIPSSRSPKFDLILVKNTARFARNVLVEDILRDLRKKGVYVKFLDLNKSTENQEDIIYIQMFQIFDEGESRKKSKAVLFGQEEGAKRGIINAGHHIYGYNYIKEGNYLEIIPPEAEVIKKIYELYSNGKGIRQVINALCNEKIKTRDGKDFSKSSIRRILTNEKYYGISIRRKYDTGLIFDKNSYPKIRDKKDWIAMELPEKIPPIINKELFDKCQSLLKNRVNHNKQRGIYKGKTEFASLLYCGKCGKTYISNMDRGRRFYNCSTKKNQGTKACDGTNISHQILNDLITTDKYIKAKSTFAEGAIRTLQDLKEKYEKQLNEIPDDKIKQIQERLNAIDLDEEILLDLRLKGTLGSKALEKKGKELEEEREKLTSELTGYTMPKEKVLETIAEIDRSMEKMTKLKFKAGYTKKEILADIEKIIIMPGNQVKVKLKNFIDESKVEIYNNYFTFTYENGSLKKGFFFHEGKVKD